MTELVKVGELGTQESITSLELVKQVNLFREQEGNKLTNHRDLMIIIETEFSNFNRKRAEGGMCPETHTLIINELKLEGIEKSTYINEQNRQEYPMYILPIDKAKQCLLKESKFVRKAVIAYINKLESAIKEQSKSPSTYIEALEALLVAEKEKERLLIENKKQSNEIVEMAVAVSEMSVAVSEMKEKVSYVDTILSSKKTVTMTQLSQDYGLSAKAMNKKLEELSVQRKVGCQWVLYASYLPCGYVQSRTVNITRSNGHPDIVLNTEWTQKGRLFLYHKLKENGIIANIEK